MTDVGKEGFACPDKVVSPAELLALRLVPGAGHVSIRTLLGFLASVNLGLAEALAQSPRALATLFPGKLARLAEILSACTPAFRREAAELIARGEEHGVRVITFQHETYPAALEQSLGKTAPVLLFVFGDARLLQQGAAGVVGTRKPTETGRELAQGCARAFAEHGIPVVSGGAQGVDTAAHETALQVGGDTIIVLPQGILSYPIPPLYVAAVKKGRAVLLSEFVPDAPWLTHAAVTRNATISALSRVVCVIEPHSEHGSLLTARHGLDQGKTIFYAGLDAAVQTLARHPGAKPLLTKSGGFQAPRLIRAFERVETSRPRQSTLF